MAKHDAIEEHLRGREPNHVLHVMASSSHGSIRDLLCKVFLPKTLTGQPYLTLEPTKEQYRHLFHSFEFRIEGRVESHGIDISSKTAYARTGKGRQWDTDIAHYAMIIEPQDLTIKHSLPGDGTGAEDFFYGNFALTASILLSPSIIYQHHLNGETKVEVVRQLSFTLDSGPKLTFQNQFKYDERPEGTLAIRELTAGFSEQLSLGSVHGVVSDLDDLLLLVSFAERHRCVCLGWSFANDKLWIEHYRRNIAVPTKNERSLNDTLIDLVYSNDFLTLAYRNFKLLEPKEPIRHGLYGTLFSRGHTLESSVLSMFSALESLTLFFRRRNNLEFTLPEVDWKDFELQIKTHIKNQPYCKENAEVRNLIYGKIKELNRPAFGEVFRRFVESYRVNVSDLWPVTGRGSLLDIRNRIIHGEIFSRPQEWALSSAVQHLQWVLERIVLAILGWSIEQSRVSPQSLKVMYAYIDWNEERKAFL